MSTQEYLGRHITTAAKTTKPIYSKYSVNVLITMYRHTKKGFFEIYILKSKKSIKSTDILRFTIEIFVYKWLLLVSIIIMSVCHGKNYAINKNFNHTFQNVCLSNSRYWVYFFLT